MKNPKKKKLVTLDLEFKTISKQKIELHEFVCAGFKKFGARKFFKYLALSVSNKIQVDSPYMGLDLDEKNEEHMLMLGMLYMSNDDNWKKEILPEARKYYKKLVDDFNSKTCGTCADFANHKCQNTEGWRKNSTCSGLGGAKWKPIKKKTKKDNG